MNQRRPAGSRHYHVCDDHNGSRASGTGKERGTGTHFLLFACISRGMGRIASAIVGYTTGDKSSNCCDKKKEGGIQYFHQGKDIGDVLIAQTPAFSVSKRQLMVSTTVPQVSMPLPQYGFLMV